MADERIIVVGAGLSGLAVAAELAPTASVTLVERLPAPGGVWGFDHPLMAALVAECSSAGVEFLLGISALRWRDGRLLVFGPGRIAWLEADRLVFAGGSRPATAAELGIAGGRLAGVFAATVAHHLLDAGVVLGRRPVVVGTAHAAGLVLPHLSHDGTVTIVGGDAPGSDWTGPPIPASTNWWPGYRPLRLTGTERVSTLVVGDGRAEFDIHCDCVVLAADPRPLRNVDGAVRDRTANVTFVQPVDPALDADAVVSRARRAAFESPHPEGAL